MTDSTDATADTDKAAKLRAVNSQAKRIGDDVVAVGDSLKELVDAYAREKPLQTVAIALGIGWLLGRRL